MISENKIAENDTISMLLQEKLKVLGMGKSSWRFFSKIKVFFLEY